MFLPFRNLTPHILCFWICNSKALLWTKWGREGGRELVKIVYLRKNMCQTFVKQLFCLIDYSYFHSWFWIFLDIFCMQCLVELIKTDIYRYIFNVCCMILYTIVTLYVCICITYVYSMYIVYCIFFTHTYSIKWGVKRFFPNFLTVILKCLLGEKSMIKYV